MAFCGLHCLHARDMNELCDTFEIIVRDEFWFCARSEEVVGDIRHNISALAQRQSNSILSFYFFL